MPILSPKTAFPTGWLADPLDRRVALARAIVGIERVLPRLWPAALFFGGHLALALTGIFAFTPWPLQALLLAATITASALSLVDGFEDFVWPRAIDGARRLERDSGLLHRPVSERGDVLVGSDPFATCTASADCRASFASLCRAPGLPSAIRRACAGIC